MPQNTNSNAVSWTEEHDEFCYRNNISPAAKTLWQWLMRHGETATDIEPDLSEFNTWVAKHRGRPYCHNYLKKALNVLIEARVINVVKQYSWKIFRLILKPLEWLKPPRKKREKKLRDNNLSYNARTSNDTSAVQGVNQQQHSISNENLVTLADEGINFDETQNDVLQRPKNEIKLAILLFKLRGGFEKIVNPEGWIRSCLRERYWEHPRNYNFLLSQFGNSIEWSELFPDI